MAKSPQKFNIMLIWDLIFWCWKLIHSLPSPQNFSLPNRKPSFSSYWCVANGKSVLLSLHSIDNLKWSKECDHIFCHLVDMISNIFTRVVKWPCIIDKLYFNKSKSAIVGWPILSLAIKTRTDVIALHCKSIVSRDFIESFNRQQRADSCAGLDLSLFHDH